MVNKRQTNKRWIALAALLAVALCVSIFVVTLGAFGEGDTVLTATLTQTENIPDDHSAETIKSILAVNVVKTDDVTAIVEEGISDYS
ncbi:MAG: hypothetical protein NC332_01860, partial [Firmicutes bacterium]|nr:hypothetical protein [Bacillota bacterium]